MATQVETLLPGNPLAKAEEHGKVIHGEPEEEEGGRQDAAKRQTGVADRESGSDSSPSSSPSPGQGGTLAPEKPSSHQEGKEDCDSQDYPDEEDTKGCDKKDFTEAPPPKVNPWTRKMNAVTVVNVNGQAHNGSYPPRTQIYCLSLLCRCFSLLVCWKDTTRHRLQALGNIFWIAEVPPAVSGLRLPPCCSLLARLNLE